MNTVLGPYEHRGSTLAYIRLEAAERIAAALSLIDDGAGAPPAAGSLPAAVVVAAAPAPAPSSPSVQYFCEHGRDLFCTDCFVGARTRELVS